jgi:hypothetical protein
METTDLSGPAATGNPVDAPVPYPDEPPAATTSTPPASTAAATSQAVVSADPAADDGSQLTLF